MRLTTAVVDWTRIRTTDSQEGQGWRCKNLEHLQTKANSTHRKTLVMKARRRSRTRSMGLEGAAGRAFAAAPGGTARMPEARRRRMTAAAVPGSPCSGFSKACRTSIAAPPEPSASDATQDIHRVRPGRPLRNISSCVHRCVTDPGRQKAAAAAASCCCHQGCSRRV